MRLERSFDVEAPLRMVWETLIDVERVAPCLPGAEIPGATDEVYEGTFTVKLGPTTADDACASRCGFGIAAAPGVAAKRRRELIELRPRPRTPEHR